MENKSIKSSQKKNFLRSYTAVPTESNQTHKLSFGNSENNSTNKIFDIKIPEHKVTFKKEEKNKTKKIEEIVDVLLSDIEKPKHKKR